MKRPPVLYDAYVSDFENNSEICVLSDTISCEVNNETNGDYSLTLVYPNESPNVDLIQQRMIIYADVGDDGMQPFRIFRVQKSMKGNIEVDAEHICNDTRSIIVRPFNNFSGYYPYLKRTNETVQFDQEAFNNRAISTGKLGVKEIRFKRLPTSYQSTSYGWGLYVPPEDPPLYGDGSTLHSWGFPWDFYLGFVPEPGDEIIVRNLNTSPSLSDTLILLKDRSICSYDYASSYNISIELAPGQDDIYGEFSLDAPVTLKELLNGQENSIRKIYDVDLLFDGTKILLRKSGSIESDLSIRYGVNLIDLNQEQSVADTYSGVYPYYKDKENYVEASPSTVNSKSAADRIVRPSDSVVESQDYTFSINYDAQTTDCDLYQITGFNSISQNIINKYGSGKIPLNLPEPCSDLIVGSSAGNETALTVGMGAFQRTNQSNTIGGEIGSIHIPEGYCGINENAFKGLPAKDIYLPNSLFYTFEDCFADCDNIENVYYSGDVYGWCEINFHDEGSSPLCNSGRKINLYLDGKIVDGEIIIPYGVTKIPDYAFAHTAIKSVFIPCTVKEIGVCAFADSDLNSVIYEGTIEKWYDIVLGNNWDDGTNHYLLFKNIEYEDTDGFGFTNLTSNTCEISGVMELSTYDQVRIPSKSDGGRYVRRIGANAFEDQGIKNCIIPDSVTEIGGDAFKDCTELETVEIPSSVTSIGASCFENCTKLREIRFCGSIQKWEAITKGSDWDTNTGEYYILYDQDYYSCVDTTSNNNGTCYVSGIGACANSDVRIPPVSKSGEKVIEISRFNLFTPPVATVSVSIPNNVKTIGDYAFSLISSLSIINIGDTVYYIDNNAFSSCENISKIKFGQYSRLRTIEEYAFWRSSQGTNTPISINFPKNVLEIRDYAFQNCAFYNNEMELSGCIVKIGNSSFRGAKGITNLIFTNDSFISFGSHSFRSNQDISNIKFAKKIKSIGNYSFYEIANLRYIEYSGTELGWYAIPKGTTPFPATSITFVFQEDIPGFQEYAYRIYLLDVTNDFDEVPTESEVREAGRAYIKNHNIGVPTVNLSVNFLKLKDTIEYSNIANVEAVHCGDIVSVFFEKLGISVSAKVTQLIYDSLNHRYIKMHIGEQTKNIADTVAEIAKSK